MGDLLPGLIYSTLQRDYPEVLPLALANVPRQFRDQKPELQYQASHCLRGGIDQINVGDRMVQLHTWAYPGWIQFKERLGVLLQVLQKTEVVKQVERFSFKYVNLIKGPVSENRLSLLNIHVDVMGKPPIANGFMLRSEVHEEKYITIVQIAPTIMHEVRENSSKAVEGLMIDVDSLSRQVGNEFWTNRDSLLDEGHMVVKRIFFALLTPTALEGMGPEIGA